MSLEAERGLVAEPTSGPRPSSGRRRPVADAEYEALRRLAACDSRQPPRTPHDSLQHVVDIAREMTDATYGALAVTSETDYVEGFIVSGMSAGEMSRLKGPPQGHGPLGSMRQDGLPVHLLDLSEHEQAFGFPPKHPAMKELLGVPIIHGGQVRGALYVTDKHRRRHFSERDRAILDVLARHAGLIINACWY